MADDSVEMNLEIPDNTGPLTQSFSNLGAIAKQMREDMQAIGDEMGTISDRADRLREYWQSNLELIQNMKSVLEIIQSLTQSNSTLISNNIMELNQMLNSSRQFGGVNGMPAGATAPGQTHAGFSDPLGNMANYTAYANQVRQTQTDPFFGAGSTRSQFDSPYNGNYYGGDYSSGYNHPGPAGSSPTDPGNIPRPPSGATGRPDDTTTYGMGKVNQPAPPPTNISDLLQSTGYAGAFPGIYGKLTNSNWQKAPYYALNQVQGQIDQTFGGIPVVGQVANATNNWLSARAQSAANQGVSGDNAFSAKEEALMAMLTKMSNFFSGQNGGGVGPALTNIAGITAQVSSIYAGIKDTTQTVRQQAYQAQSLGDIYGTVGYGRYADYRAKAAGFATGQIGNGGQLIYGNQDALSAMYAGTQLGLKNGPDLTQYQNLDYSMQTKYGLSHGETQQLGATAMAYGIDLSQMGNGYGSVRDLVSSTKTSAAYGTQAYEQGTSTAASLGFRGNAATSMGNAAVQFGAGNTIAQAQGMTGQEFMGSQIGNALFAQAAGVGYMDTYSAAQSMSAGKATGLTSEVAMKILTMAGINPSAIHSQSDLNKYAVLLNMILPQFGVTDVSTPQQAVTWAWAAIQMNRGFTGGGKKLTAAQAKASAHVAGMAQGPAQGASMMSQAVTDAQTGYTTLQSLAAGGTTSSSNLTDAQSLFGMGTSSTSTTSSGTSNVNVQVSIAPSALAILTAVVNNNSNTSPTARIPLSTTGK